MHYQVTKKSLQIAGILTLIAVLLVGTHLHIFIDEETGVLDGTAMGLAMMLLFVGCYVRSIEIKLHPIFNGVWILAGFVVMPYVMVQVIEYLSGHDVTLLPDYLFALNYFWCQIVYALLFALTNHYRGSMIAGTIICYLIGGVNHFVQAFRGTPFQISDILAAGTAADVAGSYTIAINMDLLLAGSASFLAVSLAIVAEYHRKRRHWTTITASAVLLAYVAGATSYFYSDKLWEKYALTIDYWNPLMSYANNGTALSFAMGAKHIFVEKPSGYSAQAVRSSMQHVIDEDGANISELGMGVQFYGTSGSSIKYVPKTEATNTATIERPNIITIMNESYADLSILGNFSTNYPVMEYMKSLNKNTIKGNMAVSVLGGGTCNTEFEFLTGLNMAFLPSGVMTYSQYIDNDIDSMATILKDQGYTSVAFHPGKATSWARDSVYAHMGFEEFYTAEDMDNPTYMREAYISDSSNYQHVIRLFEEKDEAEKLFLFNVTIQNHGGYMLDVVGIPQWVAMRGDYRKYNQTEQYLSLMRASDKALEELITYFQKVDEPTMIVFFGDHQPNVENEFIEDLMGKSLTELNMEEVQKRYTVPFFIWTNYDIEEAYYETISVNYLSTLAMEVAGVELPVYHQYLSKLYQHLPVVNALGYADGDGAYYFLDEETDLTPYLNGYEMIQYDYLFGGRNRVGELYKIDEVQVDADQVDGIQTTETNRD